MPAFRRHSDTYTTLWLCCLGVNDENGEVAADDKAEDVEIRVLLAPPLG